MNAKLMQRLDRLDRAVHAGFTTLLEQIMKAAVAALSDEDLNLISEWLRRGPVPFSECKPEEQAALARYGADRR